ncbi:glutamate receptor ionotropic, kainate 2-like [Frankliniella occidentalis]|uniref:Glutamate receptor ionotropic, kainate 2-like n=1 Tax=Frankliniella occidentalis TaxID=133901 RepID=A0A9C6XD62_FRAOC|nr:glutamate receptor ionotropic, kainate 2-like [Frankliniella occidentalis]
MWSPGPARRAGCRRGVCVPPVTVLLLLVCLSTRGGGLPPIINIGAIFTEDQRDSAAELAFKYAVYRINQDPILLPHTELRFHIEYVAREDSFHAAKQACRLVGGGVHALFGPTDPLLGTHVHSVCDALDIPHLEVRLDPDTHYREFSINLHPSQDMLNRAFIDLMGFLNWTKVAVIYEEDSGLMRLRDLVREDTELYVRQADPAYYRAVLKDIKAKEIYNLIVDTRADTMRFFLREVLQLQMNDYKYHFVFTTFDMESFDLEDFKYNFVNITSFRIVDAEDMSVREVLKDMEVNLNKSKGIQAHQNFLDWLYLPGGAYMVRTALYHTHTPVVVPVRCRPDQEFPYVMMHYEKNYTGNARFYGFCVDLLARVSREVGFDYIIDLVPDRKYGAQDPATGEWNGMVLQLMKHKADLAVGSMTINYARESVIDFTKPFMNLGISILFKVPTSQPTRLFSFMNPLSVHVWMFVVLAYILVSLTMYVTARFSPYEWRGPLEFAANHFSIVNCFWFAIGTLMQQGSDLNPRAASTRIVGGIWWFFTLIIIASYTANLAAFLTVERMITPIENAEDLAGQTDIAYGTLEGGSTMTFFRDSMIETYKKMWRFMENKKPSVFVSTYEEGIQRVLQGNYAFLMESTMLDYIVQRDCNLTSIGDLLDSKGYGIATPIGSPWRDKISLVILELQEKGEIQMLYDKWWKNMGSTCERAEKGKENKANSLGVANIGGVFVVLLCGLAVAMTVAIFEFCYFTRRISARFEMVSSADGGTCWRALRRDPLTAAGPPPLSLSLQAFPQPSLCSQIADELCLAVTCDSRPVHHIVAASLPPPPPAPPPPRAAVRSRSLGALPQAVPALAPVAPRHPRHQDDLALCTLPPPPPPHLLALGEADEPCLVHTALQAVQHQHHHHHHYHHHLPT